LIILYAEHYTELSKPVVAKTNRMAVEEQGGGIPDGPRSGAR
jgi:hypothetical protein